MAIRRQWLPRTNLWRERTNPQTRPVRLIISRGWFAN
jgi:hypothetical protein